MKKFLQGFLVCYALIYSVGATYIIYKGGKKNV